MLETRSHNETSDQTARVRLTVLWESALALDFKKKDPHAANRAYLLQLLPAPHAEDGREKAQLLIQTQQRTSHPVLP